MKEIQSLYNKIIEDLNQINNKDTRIKRITKNVENLNILYDRSFQAMIRRVNDMHQKLEVPMTHSRVVSKSPTKISSQSDLDTTEKERLLLLKIEEENRALRDKCVLQEEVMKAVDEKFYEYEVKFKDYEEVKKSLQEELQFAVTKHSQEIQKVKTNMEAEQEVVKFRKQIDAMTEELSATKAQKSEDLNRYQNELRILKSQIEYVKTVKEEEIKTLREQVQSYSKQLTGNSQKDVGQLNDLKSKLDRFEKEKKKTELELAEKEKQIVEVRKKCDILQKDNLRLSGLLKEKDEYVKNEMSKYESRISQVRQSIANIRAQTISTVSSPTQGRNSGIKKYNGYDNDGNSGAIKPNIDLSLDTQSQNSYNAQNKNIDREMKIPESKWTMKRRSSLMLNEPNSPQTLSEKVIKETIEQKEKNIKFLWSFIKKLQKNMEINIKDQKELEASYLQRMQDYENIIKDLKSQLDILIVGLENKEQISISKKEDRHTPHQNRDYVPEKHTHYDLNESSPTFEKRIKRAAGTNRNGEFMDSDEEILPRSDPGLMFRKEENSMTDSDQDLVTFFSKSDRLTPISKFDYPQASDALDGTFGDFNRKYI